MLVSRFEFGVKIPTKLAQNGGKQHVVLLK